MLKNLFFLSISGSLGTILRVLAIQLLQSLGLKQHLHLTTLFVNILGCFIAGFFWKLCEKESVLEAYQFYIFAGFLAAFTTFSAFSLDLVKLIDKQHYLSALIYFLSSNIFGLLACLLGIKSASLKLF